jgi:hypothetical protein
MDLLYPFINGCECTRDYPLGYILIQPDHTYLFGLTLKNTVEMEEVILKHEWNHAKLTYEDSGMKPLPKECRLHIFKQESSTEDFQFTNPYKERIVNGDVFYDVDDVREDDVDEEDDDDDDHHSQ